MILKNRSQNDLDQGSKTEYGPKMSPKVVQKSPKLVGTSCISESVQIELL